MNEKDRQAERVSDSRLPIEKVENRQTRLNASVGKIIFDGRTYSIDALDQILFFHSGTISDLGQFENALQDLKSHWIGASSTDRKTLEKNLQSKFDKLKFLKRSRPRNAAVPIRLKPEYRAFEVWLLEELGSLLSKNLKDMNFSAWCSANVPEFKSVEFGPEEFLSAATGIDLCRIQEAFRILGRRLKPSRLIDLQQQGKYLSFEELDLCMAACREWCGYSEPGTDQAAAIIRALFEEMNLRGVDKHELSRRAKVAAHTLDSWNNSNVAKRKAPSLQKASACLEAMGLRLSVTPEADFFENHMLREENCRLRNENHKLGDEVLKLKRRLEQEFGKKV